MNRPPKIDETIIYRRGDGEFVVVGIVTSVEANFNRYFTMHRIPYLSKSLWNWSKTSITLYWTDPAVQPYPILLVDEDPHKDL